MIHCWMKAWLSMHSLTNAVLPAMSATLEVTPAALSFSLWRSSLCMLNDSQLTTSSSSSTIIPAAAPDITM